MSNIETGEISIQLTSNMLKSSIINANANFRKMLKEHEICDFADLENGEENGVEISVSLQIGEDLLIDEIKLYKTKKRGEPRFWIPQLRNDAVADDEIVITPNLDSSEEKLFVIAKPAMS